MKSVLDFLEKLFEFLIGLFRRRRFKLVLETIEYDTCYLTYTLHRSAKDVFIEFRDAEDSEILYWLEVPQSANGKIRLPIAYAVLQPGTYINCFVSSELGTVHPKSPILSFKSILHTNPYSHE